MEGSRHDRDEQGEVARGLLKNEKEKIVMGRGQ